MTNLQGVSPAADVAAATESAVDRSFLPTWLGDCEGRDLHAGRSYAVAPDAFLQSAGVGIRQPDGIPFPWRH